MVKKADIILIGLFCVFAVCFLFVFEASGQSGGRAVIKCEGVQYKALPLQKDAVYELYSSDNALLNTVEIKNGAAFMAYASCPDGLCRQQGRIKHTNETLVCLPNRVTVEIIGGEKSRFDGIAQ